MTTTCGSRTFSLTPPMTSRRKRFRALDLRVETKPDLTPGLGRRPGDRGLAAQHPAPVPAARRRARRGVRADRHRAAALGHRPDRRHEELRPRRPRLGHAHRADGRRRGGGGRGHRARARAALVGRGRRRRLDRPVADQGQPRCRVSQVSKLSDASFSYSGIGGWAETGRLDGFLSLSQAVWRTRGFGDFWSHMLVAEGAVDVSAEPDVSLWDLAALQVIVRGGGRPVHQPRRGRDARRRQRRLHQRPPPRRGARPSRLTEQPCARGRALPAVERRLLP